MYPSSLELVTYGYLPLMPPAHMCASVYSPVALFDHTSISSVFFHLLTPDVSEGGASSHICICSDSRPPALLSPDTSSPSLLSSSPSIIISASASCPTSSPHSVQVSLEMPFDLGPLRAGHSQSQPWRPEIWASAQLSC